MKLKVVSLSKPVYGLSKPTRWNQSPVWERATRRAFSAESAAMRQRWRAGIFK